VVEKVEETKKKLEHDAIPKALNDFTRHKEEKERNEQQQNEAENEDGDWGKTQDDDEDEEDETSEQISKNEVPPRKLVTEEISPKTSAIITEETFPVLSNGIPNGVEENNECYRQVSRKNDWFVFTYNFNSRERLIINLMYKLMTFNFVSISKINKNFQRMLHYKESAA